MARSRWVLSWSWWLVRFPIVVNLDLVLNSSNPRRRRRGQSKWCSGCLFLLSSLTYFGMGERREGRKKVCFGFCEISWSVVQPWCLWLEMDKASFHFFFLLVRLDSSFSPFLLPSSRYFWLGIPNKFIQVNGEKNDVNSLHFIVVERSVWVQNNFFATL